MRLPELDRPLSEVDALRHPADALSWEDADDIYEQLAKLRMLAILLNARLTAPAIPEV